MTAEVAILNRSAVALAADSAVTISSKASAKVYNTVNKLFALSTRHPVGIMIYGGADYMSVPWETIVKLYRAKLGTKELDTIEAYVTDFVEFVRQNIHVTDEDQQRRVFQIWGSYFDALSGRLQSLVLRERKKRTLSDADIAKLFLKLAKEQNTNLKHRKTLDYYSNVNLETAISKYRKEFDSAKTACFKGRRITVAINKALKEFAWLLLVKDHFADGISGVVIAGFGQDDLLPGYGQTIWSGKVLDQLRVKKQPCVMVKRTEDESSIIHAFAQNEMVVSFMEGASELYQHYIREGVTELMDLITTKLIMQYSSGNEQTKRMRAGRVRKTTKKMTADFLESARNFRHERFVNRVMEVVTILPKEELAELAGALVSLTSLKRRISMDADTVGGPIDVAVISKGDGFIWIRRKQYFRPELNPFFVNRHLMAHSKQEDLGNGHA